MRFWSSYRKTGERPSSRPSCCTPCSLYTDSRKACRPALAFTRVMMEKFSGKEPVGTHMRRDRGKRGERKRERERERWREIERDGVGRDRASDRIQIVKLKDEKQRLNGL